MAQIYLYLNSAVYFALAVWGTMAPQRTTTRLGYLIMSERGRAEFLTTYGGLQVGFGILFFLLARSGDLMLGLRIAIGIYAPIVLYRIVTGLMNLPAFGSTLGAVALEALLLIIAIWILQSSFA